MAKIPTTKARDWIAKLEGGDRYAAMDFARDVEGSTELRLIHECLEAGDGEDDARALADKLRELRASIQWLPSEQIKETLGLAAEREIDPIETQDVSEPQGFDPPTWPTGLDSLDALIGGGASLFTVAGTPKVGKSMFAVGAACSAAMSGKWRVIYCNAEMSRNEMGKRVRRFCHGSIPDALIDNMTILNLNVGVNVKALVREIVDRVQIQDQRLLVVIDSINRVCDLSAEAGHDNEYWDRMREWTQLALQSSRHNLNVSWLLISELNRKLEVKGQSLEYTSSTCVTIARTQAEGIVKIDVPLARSSAGGEVGVFGIDHARGRFVGGEGE